MKLLESIYRKLYGDAPYWTRYPLLLLIWKPIRKFLNVIIIPAIPFNGLRILLYRLVGYKIGKKVFIGMRCYLDDMEPSLTVIEDNVVISYGCYFACHGKNQNHTPIIIKKGAYIGTGSQILSGKGGIVIGENAIVGGGSVVVKSIPDNSIAVGNPARVIKGNQEI